MTDYRRTEEELWEEEVVAEDDRPTRVLPVLGPQVQATEATSADLHDLPSTAAAEERDGGAATANGESVESVARFITEPLRQEATIGRQVDSPSWSLSALSLIENDTTAAPGRPVERAQPPAIPADALPAHNEPLPSMMLGPAMSTRSEVTERVTTIPKTHPLANSIAPGGSLVTVPPGTARGAHRWQFALGGLALIVLGGGAAVFLQSRGEHHAASGTPQWLDQEIAEREVLVEPMAETMVIIEDSPAPTLLDAPPAPAEETAGTQEETAGTQDEVTEDDGDLASMVVHQAEPEGEPGTAKRASDREPVRAKGRRGDADDRAAALQISVGSVQLRTRDAPEPAAEAEGVARPQRAEVIGAMNEIATQLRACVGEEHGIADVTLTVRGSGVVSHALVEGPFAGSPKGSCIARSLRSARLPPFADPLLRIAYPLQL